MLKAIELGSISEKKQPAPWRAAFSVANYLASDLINTGAERANISQLLLSLT
jgi:hypothetical protein